jgi:hypothetical protein
MVPQIMLAMKLAQRCEPGLTASGARHRGLYGA